MDHGAYAFYAHAAAADAAGAAGAGAGAGTGAGAASSSSNPSSAYPPARSPAVPLSAIYTRTHVPSHFGGGGAAAAAAAASGGGAGGGAGWPSSIAPSGGAPSDRAIDRRASRRRAHEASPSSLRGLATATAPPLVPESMSFPPVSSGFRRVRDPSELRPYNHAIPPRGAGRRADPAGGFVSPLKALTSCLHHTYHMVNPSWLYELEYNPRRVLTKPSKPTHNQGRDNESNDFILYVNDWLGSDDGDRYLILDMLGQGTFGQVVKCQNMRTHDIVAVKVIKNHPAYLQQSWTEVSVLKALNEQWDRHDDHHLLRLDSTFLHAKHLCLVFELLSSNLYELIRQNSYRGVSTWLVKMFTSQLLDALQVLANARIIHCDMKPENILLKSLQPPLAIKLVDFGSACHVNQTVYSYIQSRFYRAPEVLLGVPYNAAIDMWSLGCIAAELFLGLPLFPGTSELNQITCIVEMLGDPPRYMLENGKQSSQFFQAYNDEYGRATWVLKSREQWGREHPDKINEPPSKKFFAATTLPDIIRTYPLPQSRHSTPGGSSRSHDPAKEQQQRDCFIDFLSGLLQMDPLLRWTPQQALLHPFVTGEKFIAPFVPPPTTKTHAQLAPEPSSHSNRHVSQPPPIRSPRTAPATQVVQPPAPSPGIATQYHPHLSPLAAHPANAALSSGPSRVHAHQPLAAQPLAAQPLVLPTRMSYPPAQPQAPLPSQRYTTTGRDYAAEAASYTKPALPAASGPPRAPSTGKRHTSLLPPPHSTLGSMPPQRTRASMVLDASGTSLPLPPPFPAPSRRRSVLAPAQRTRDESTGLLPSPVFAPPPKRYAADSSSNRDSLHALQSMEISPGGPSTSSPTFPLCNPHASRETNKEFSVRVDGQPRRDTPGAAPSTPGTPGHPPGRPGPSPRTQPTLNSSASMGSLSQSAMHHPISPGGYIPPVPAVPPVPPAPPMPSAPHAHLPQGATSQTYDPARGIAPPPPLPTSNRGTERVPIRREVSMGLPSLTTPAHAPPGGPPGFPAGLPHGIQTDVSNLASYTARPLAPHAVSHPPSLAPALSPLPGGSTNARIRPGHPYSPSSRARLDYSPRHWSGPPVGYTQP